MVTFDVVFAIRFIHAMIKCLESFIRNVFFITFKFIKHWLIITTKHMTTYETFGSFVFGCAGSLLLHQLFSSVGEPWLFASCGAQASHRDATVVAEHGL